MTEDLKTFQRENDLVADGAWGPNTDVAVVKALKDTTRKAATLSLHLTENFTLRELLHSDTAVARGLANVPTATYLASLRALCLNILEPVREKFGAVRITSGFRIFTPSSQHGKGEAADFEVTGISNRLVAEWIRDTLPFDQLILEAYRDNDVNAGWIHTSYRKSGGRKSVLRTPTGGAPYSAGLGK